MKYVYYTLAGIASIQVAQLMYMYRQYLETREFRTSASSLLRYLLSTVHSVQSKVEAATTQETEAEVATTTKVEAATTTKIEAATTQKVEADAISNSTLDEESSGEAAYVDDYIGRDMSKDDPDVLWSRSFGGEMEVRDN